MINGAPCGAQFCPKGLRQGNPLSPLFFVVVMEALSRIMSTTVDRVLLDGFIVGLSAVGMVVALVICR